MGLDTDFGCWHGSYMGFSEWRTAVAEAAGISLSSMEGCGGSIPWDLLPLDPIHPLLNHSDCEGSINWGVCAALADRLEELAPKVPDGWMRKRCYVFAEGARKAYAAQTDIEFHWRGR